MNADAKLDATVGRDACVAFDHSALHFDGAAYGPLEHTSVVHGDGGIDEIAAQSSEPRQGAILVRAGKATETDHIGGQDRREFPFFRHWSPSRSAT